MIFMPLLLMFVLFSLPGCVHPINWNNPIEIANAVRIEQDDFKKMTTFTGPNCAADQPDDIVRLRSWKLRGSTLGYQIYVSDEYTYPIGGRRPGWRLYSEVFDSDGNRLPTTLINRHLDWCGSNVCSYIETLGVDIGISYLEARKDRGIKFKISGNNGEEVFSIPPAYIQAFLSVVQR